MQFCCTLKVSDECSELLFDDKQLKDNNQCDTFHQLFCCSQLNLHLNWNDCLILESIIALTGLKEAEDELEKKIISDTFSVDDLPLNNIKLSIIVDEPYTKLTLEQYNKLKDFIFTTLKVKKYITYPYIRFFFESLHLEWHIPAQAAKHIVKTAISHVNESAFLEHSIVFMKVGNEVFLDCSIKQVRTSGQDLQLLSVAAGKGKGSSYVE